MCGSPAHGGCGREVVGEGRKTTTWQADLAGCLHRGRGQLCADLELLFVLPRLKIVRALFKHWLPESTLPIDPSFCQPITMHHACLGSFNHFFSPTRPHPWPQCSLSLSLSAAPDMGSTRRWSSVSHYITLTCPSAQPEEERRRVGIFGKTSLLNHG